MISPSDFLFSNPLHHLYWYLINSGKSCVRKICLWGKSLCGKSFTIYSVRKNFPLRLSGKSYWVVKAVQKEMWTGIECVKNTLTELMKDLLYGRIITSSLFGFHLDIFDLFLTLSDSVRNNIDWSIYEYCLGKSVRTSCDFIWVKFVIHSVRFLSGKSFFFVWKIFRADSALFFVILPCSTIPLFTFFLFCTEIFCCSEEVVTELLSEY